MNVGLQIGEGKPAIAGASAGTGAELQHKQITRREAKLSS